MSSNAIAIEYLKGLLGKVRKDNTKGMLSTRVPAADSQPTDPEEDSEELNESELERLLESDDSPQAEAMEGGEELGEGMKRDEEGELKSARTMGRGVVGFSRKR